MRLVNLGNTGLMTSEFGFGGIPIQRLGYDDAIKVVRGCLDAGVNLIDTAERYGTSEQRIGAAIAGRGQRVILASKSMAATGSEMEAHLQQSLSMLGVDHIHLYQLHNVSNKTRLEEVYAPGGPLDVLRRAKREGVVGHIGVSSHQFEIAKDLVLSGDFETMMFPLNFIAYEPGLEVLEVCRREGIAFLAMKPLGGGMLTSATLAFRYLRQFPDVIPIVGIQRLEEVAEIAELYDSPQMLSDEDNAEIHRLRREIGIMFCRRCDYCQPCPAGIPISKVMSFPTLLSKLPIEQVLGRNGEGSCVELVRGCQECGQCEDRCPYQLPIRARLATILDIYRDACQKYYSD